MNELIEKLNVLLATQKVFYQKLNNYHWNVKGQNFFTLHAKFEELYGQVTENSDAVAERILMLGGKPDSLLSEYLENSEIEENASISVDVDMVSDIVSDLKTIIDLEKEIIDLASQEENEGTMVLMDEFIPVQEKNIWMLMAFLG